MERDRRIVQGDLNQRAPRCRATSANWAGFPLTLTDRPSLRGSKLVPSRNSLGSVADSDKQVSINGNGSVGSVTPSTLRSSDGLVSALALVLRRTGARRSSAALPAALAEWRDGPAQSVSPTFARGGSDGAVEPDVCWRRARADRPKLPRICLLPGGRLKKRAENQPWLH